ncbi:Eco57I restriction-modification methylase domain-containing protein [Dyadobacter sp. CY323]|uniref:type IIG restriction enzyme/methyltransferase n=1 Tax=Dyadobacter sp. CY323 TaxID=2907302 RepID=UPI001F192C84|nr:TaqI-like C-terminal specificity domain-containing protein [Dyadobacter sp. CY323]MCE6989015.1 BREX-1 system adenine-specific DNA-methyltransferase PglX [Dyadobacter sp. CY323]
MIVLPREPRVSLNKSFLKVKPNRKDIEKFKLHLIHLLDSINEKESEEHHKFIISKFLEKTYYDGKHYINTKDRKDLVIHLEDNKSPVAVIIEAKKPTNKNEMLKVTNLNTKAFHELLLYYLRERITLNNISLKYIVATNIYEWFIFDAKTFEKAFAEDHDLVGQFKNFEEKRLVNNNTEFFYKSIAAPAIDKFLSGLSKAGKEVYYTHFDVSKYDKILRNNNPDDDNKLIALYKIFSPEHLLKQPFKNDSNSLDKGFYGELLHIIGLTEVSDGGKKLIDRKEESKRDNGSLIENTIHLLESLNKLKRLDKPSLFGANNVERYFNVGLELSITWINRVLFLKLLEAQLLTYNKGDNDFKFLNSDRIKSYDELDSLFFDVLAMRVEHREDVYKKPFSKVPYLNSSLFVPTELEQRCFSISQLKDNKEIPIFSKTVLKDSNGQRKSGKMKTLDYLFTFLDSFDFSSEGSEAIQEENKTLINASVLGLIFEKINGYKDGSFFTPGFITMYMCRETIRGAVLQKFYDAKGWECKTIDQLYDKITDKKEANAIINSLRICDPAVGSGHFLVSALNEIIALKSDLKILMDKDGRTLRDYQIEVDNDELSIHSDGILFEYSSRNPESQRVQETLFNEKKTIIENCLFGVDINSNSVKICRLRLWIELLKSAYYKADRDFSELETLPNIDINIKCGNSLISRNQLGTDLSHALKKAKITISSYKQAVQNYQHAQSKEERDDMEDLISTIKNNFRTEISNSDPKVRKLRSKRGELDNILNQRILFELSKAEEKSKNLLVLKLQNEVDKLETEIDEIKSNKIFENAFEWLFEFPEVLDEKGKFVGFDIVIANPPYGVDFSDGEKAYLKSIFPISSIGKMDSYKLFYEQSFRLLKKNYFQAFIAPNTFLYNVQSKSLRSSIIANTTIKKAVELRKNIFEDAPDVVTVILILKYSRNDSYNFPVKVAFPNVKYTDIDGSKWMIDQNIPISTFAQDEEKKINLRRDFRLDFILTKMNTYPRLDDQFLLKQGTKPYGEKDNKEKLLLSKTDKGYPWERALNGRNLAPFSINWEHDFVLRSTDLHSCLEQSIVSSPKIYFQRMRKISLFPRIVAAYDDETFHGLYTCSVIYPKANATLNLKYVVALLNSHLINIWYKNYDTDIEIKLASVKNIPIPIISSDLQSPIVNLVDMIMQSKKVDDTVNALKYQDELDCLVYDIFGLTPDEILLVKSLTG